MKHEPTRIQLIRPRAATSAGRLPVRLLLAFMLAMAFGWRSAAAQVSGVRSISNTGRVDIILVAHQDDWQLFMGDVVARQIQAGNRVVFIYLTAGDDGRDSVYWMTRERAALESTRVGVGATVLDSSVANCSTTRALEHPIRRCMIANTESYFLRLPDGQRNGIGFARHSGASLRRLRGKSASSISAVDGSTVYKGWTDLVATVTVLIGDSSAARPITIHTSDPNVVINPHDHFDHRMAGLLVAGARRTNRWNVVYYAGYALATRAPNRSRNQSRQKVALFQAYDAAMTRMNPAWGAYSEHPAFYSQCMLRTYGRKIAWR